MADEPLYRVEDFSLEEAPRHLRTAAAMGPVVCLTINNRAALRLARLIERDSAGARIVVVETEKPLPRWAVVFWSLFIAVQVYALLEGPARALAAVIIGGVQ